MRETREVCVSPRTFLQHFISLFLEYNILIRSARCSLTDETKIKFRLFPQFRLWLTLFVRFGISFMLPNISFFHSLAFLCLLHTFFYDDTEINFIPGNRPRATRHQLPFFFISLKIISFFSYFFFLLFTLSVIHLEADCGILSRPTWERTLLIAQHDGRI